MHERRETIRRRFSVETENLLLAPADLPPGRPAPLLVALHGMGMTAPEFAELLDPLVRALPARVLVPDGVLPYEIRSGERIRIGRAWYLYTGDEAAFLRSMESSGRHLDALIRDVVREHPADPGVFLLGYSQGGYFAGYWGIRRAARFAGLVVMGARVKHESLAGRLRLARRLPVLVVHGRRDRAVPFARAMESRDALAAAGVPVEFVAHEAGHALTPEALAPAAAWLGRLMTPDLRPRTAS